MTTNDDDLLERLRDAERQVQQARAELEELHQRLSLLRAVTDSVSDAIFVKDLAGCYLMANRAAALRLGKAAPDEVLGHDDRSLLGPVEAARIRADDLRAMASTGGITFEEVRRVHGTARHYLTSKAPHRDATGQVVGVLGIARDISDRKRAVEELRRRETTLAQAGQMAHLGAWDVDVRNRDDLNANTLTWSDEVYRIFGYEPGAVVVTNDLFFERVHPDDRPRVVQAVAEAIATRRPYGIEHRIVRPDGSERVVQEHAELVFDERGELIRIIGAVQDVTDRKLAEDALREADRRKTEFLSMLSHELRNPLSPIQNCLFILDRVPHEGEQARRARATIGRQVEHLTRLVGDLLEVSRVSRGRIRLRRERVDLAALVGRTLDDHRPLFASREVDVELAAEGESIWVNGDATRLSQVLANLLDNSAKFTQPGGRVLLELRRDGTSAILSVRDTGLGMPPDVLARLFEPFTQADHSLDRSSGGLGLGLSLVKGLVELHGGQVWAESEGLGRGATFTVRLPAEVDLQRCGPPLLELVSSPRSRRVLLIEDSVDAAESLKDALELDGHEVMFALTGDDGLSKARAHIPDVVLCDIGLPGMDGYEVARAFRADEVLREIPLIALTGYAGPEDRQQAAEAGFDHHLAKPPDMKLIECLLAEIPPRVA